jgi:hypothetical protein
MEDEGIGVTNSSMSVSFYFDNSQSTVHFFQTNENAKLCLIAQKYVVHIIDQIVKSLSHLPLHSSRVFTHAARFAGSLATSLSLSLTLSLGCLIVEGDSYMQVLIFALQYPTISQHYLCT